MFHHCDDSNNAPSPAASYARTAKEGREPLSRVPFFLLPLLFSLSLYLSIRVYLFLPSSLTWLLFHPSPRYFRFVRSIPPPFFHLFIFFYYYFFFFLEKVRDSYFLTLRIFSPPPCARVWRTTARIVVVILFFSFFLGFENGTREMFVSSLRLLAETI